MRLGNRTVQAPVGGLQMSANMPNTNIVFSDISSLCHLFNFQRTLRRETTYCADPRKNLSVPVYSCRGIVERIVCS